MSTALRATVLCLLAFVSCISLADQNDAQSVVQGPASESSPSPVSSPEVGVLKKSSTDFSATPGSTTSWPVVILTLIGIVAFIFVLAWMAKRFGGLSAMGMRDLKVVAAMPVGTREKVAIIDVKGQQFLIGITAQNINHLHTFEEPAITSEEKRTGEFADKLAKIMNQKNKNGVSDNEV